jgi:hypothetical protein
MAMRIDDGWQTLITLANAPSIKLYEKSVTPPGIMMGGPNDTTTMRNLVWRTRAPKKLKTMDDLTFEAAYDPAVYPDIVDQIGVVQEVTVKFPDDSTLVFWGWIDTFKPNAIVEGSQPTASCTIVCGNQDEDGVETDPVFTDG